MNLQDSPFDLKGRVAIVTGAGQSVGRGIAHVLAAHNAGGIAVNDYFADRAEAVVAEIREMGVKAVPMVCDVSDYEAVKAGVAQVERELGPVSILVNNAGNAGPSGYQKEFPLFWTTEPADWDRFFKVNLFGVMYCTRAVLPGMVERKHGRIVTIISDASRTTESRMADYCAAKAGAAGFMRGIAGDGGRFGVTANNISISTIDPPNMTPERREARMTSDAVKAQLSKYVIRRFGQPSDVAGVALLLASDAGAWITGQTYPVNGGYLVSL
jgi:NAD(P)-dependent dehydrogenase (short-subunit alcohol dehydrogenase family)